MTLIVVVEDVELRWHTEKKMSCNTMQEKNVAGVASQVRIDWSCHRTSKFSELRKANSM